MSAQLLRENGFEINAANFDEESALRWATIHGHEGPMQLLLERGVEIDAKDDKGRTALHLAAENGREAITLQLLEKGADAMTKSEAENTVLHWAAENGLEMVVRELLKKRVNIEARNVYKNTALHWAAWAGQEAVVRLLLDNGAAIKARGDAGLNALHRAAWYGHQVVVQLLLEKGADVNEKDRDGKTALSWAAQYGREGVMQVLLENLADVNEKDEDGQTALHLAALNGHELAIRLLLQHSADVEALDFGREKALDLAIRSGHHAVTELLRESGIPIIPPISNSSGESERKLARYFPDFTNPLGKHVNGYGDFEIQEISRLLEQTSNRLSSHSPRIYIVLRTIGALEYVEKFINSGITDLWFPFSPEHIPQGIRPSTCEKFLDTQRLVLTAGFKLKDSKHYCLAEEHLNRDGFPKRLEWKAELGSGGFGVVFKVLGSEEYALKLIHRRRQFSQTLEVMQYFKSELEILKKINHHHFVKLAGSYTSPNYVGLIMSPVANDNLASFLLKVPELVDKRHLLWSFFGCLANALAYLHFTLKIRHKDIKPQNILVKKNVILLTDFGMALDWGDKMQTTTRQESRRTTLYCAPEAAKDEPRRSSSDIWSLGCVYLEMITVLNGYTIEDMRSFFDKKGTKVRNFWGNLEAISIWIAKFREQGGKEFGNAPLGWIEMMLQEDSDRRPDARYLRDLIVDSRPEEQSSTTLYGSCCSERTLEINDSGSESGVLSQVSFSS
jgi:ankyrin repeat protein